MDDHSIAVDRAVCERCSRRKRAIRPHTPSDPFRNIPRTGGSFSGPAEATLGLGCALGILWLLWQTRWGRSIFCSGSPDIGSICSEFSASFRR
jgi:hypothetical protein